MMIDPFGRVIDYLRVSVTDRCNFRCVYCMPEEGAPVAPPERLLAREEIERLLGIGARLGLRKVRLTGGEPLLRKDLPQLVQTIARLPGIQDLSLTTNGFLLARAAPELAAAGLGRVNVSLDTLRPERFQALARRGRLEAVLEGLEAAERAGLTPIKLNTVVLRGLNEDEVVDLARLSRERAWDVRFIELMPVRWSEDEQMDRLFALAGQGSAGGGARAVSPAALFPGARSASFRALFALRSGGQAPRGVLDGGALQARFVSSAETRARIEAALGPLEPAEVLSNGPARSFRLSGARGTVGFISQVSRDLCAGCNRLRLTADGQLRPCLMADGEVDLRTPLRSGASDPELAGLILRTVRHKPREHRLEDGIAPTGRNMSQLGG